MSFLEVGNLTIGTKALDLSMPFDPENSPLGMDPKKRSRFHKNAYI